MSDKRLRPLKRRKSRREPSNKPAIVLAKAAVHETVRYFTAPIWIPLVVIRTIRDRVGRIFRQAQVEGAAARRQRKRADRDRPND